MEPILEETNQYERTKLYDQNDFQQAHSNNHWLKKKRKKKLRGKKRKKKEDNIRVKMIRTNLKRIW